MGEVLKASKESIERAAAILQAGGLVAFPTETVYGLGASALDPKAVARVFEVKNRPSFDPFIVHIADSSDLEQLCTRINEKAYKLIDKFWPGPLTLVLPKSDIIPDIVTAGNNTLAVRMPSHPIALELIRQTGLPIAAPSANPFSRLSPTTADHVKNQIGSKIDLIIDGGSCAIGVESTVLELTEEAVLLRPGGITIEEIEEVIGPIKTTFSSAKPHSPGQLLHHYSPHTHLQIIKDENFVIPNEIRAGLITFKGVRDQSRFKNVEVLSESGDLYQAASNLFSALHRLDVANLDIIYAEAFPETGIGMAIMDRLKKAEHKS
ncbi:MAG: L-threonylcarbamoyladenylate synthase [Spirochaetia bacterium]|jgi:L-threonylcarbamoyladenylate synthase|nr:L-threonylcarbamoyladenylate synthase [Spirochaetia bacterium]